MVAAKSVSSWKDQLIRNAIINNPFILNTHHRRNIEYKQYPYVSLKDIKGYKIMSNEINFLHKQLETYHERHKKKNMNL